MKYSIIQLLFLLLFVISCDPPVVRQLPKEYIATVRPVTDIYHGVEIIDHYRYMEDIDAQEVQDWIRSQASYAADILNGLEHKETFYNRLEEVDQGKPFRIYALRRMMDGGVFYIKRKKITNVFF